MSRYNLPEKKYIISGIIGSQIPSYGACLWATGGDPLKALGYHILNTVARVAMVATSLTSTGGEAAAMFILPEGLAAFGAVRAHKKIEKTARRIRERIDLGQKTNEL
jgi:hypothetical protein